MPADDRHGWPQTGPPATTTIEERIDAQLNVYMQLATERRWLALPEATAAQAMDATVQQFLEHFADTLRRGSPQHDLDSTSQGIYAAIAAQSPTTCGSLRLLFRELALAALFPAEPLAPEEIARWRQLPRQGEAHPGERSHGA